MINVTSAYKEIMSRPVRNRSYLSIGIGIVNQNAQSSGIVEADLAYWSNGNIFNTNQHHIEYATLEENFFKLDGSMYFMPENEETMQLQNNGISTENPFDPISIVFPQIYAIKGITIDFGDAYPTRFTITTKEKTLSYENNNAVFITMDVLGDTDKIVITPFAMVGGEKRFRIKSVLMGVGLSYTNEQTKQLSYTENVSPISENIPNTDFSYSFFDEENRFNVDDDNSFIDYLETMQPITLSFGLELDNGNLEWHQFATLYLKDWKSQKGEVTFTATDRLSQMEDEYSIGYKIYQRTAYQEAQSIFSDAGMEPDEYYIDEYLHDIILTNPMPISTHKECLQILANACRCIIRQDENGRILIRANFANVLDPDDLYLSTNGTADWSKPQNILTGSIIAYADLSEDFLKLDGSLYFMPEDSGYLETGYVSSQESNENGVFAENPTITISLPAAYTYFGISIHFDGNPPKEMIIHTYNSDTLLESTEFTDMSLHSVLFHEFANFDKITLEFTKGYPYNRILVNKVSFGDLSDYVLTKFSMMENPVGYKEKRVKSVRIRRFSYVNNAEGEPEEIENLVYSSKPINSVGEIKTLENPLVGTEEHALLLAEWIGNYYANNISYDVKYRGEPRINAADIIYMESEKLSNLQVEITSHDLSFNGAFSGTLELRRALKMMGG